MPDKECSINLMELSYAMGQLDAVEGCPLPLLESLLTVMGPGWECRQGGRTQKAWDKFMEAVVGGTTTPTGGAGSEVARQGACTDVWNKYHIWLKESKYWDAETMEAPRRGPVPAVGVRNNKLVLEDYIPTEAQVGDLDTILKEDKEEIGGAGTGGDPVGGIDDPMPKLRTQHQQFNADCLGKNTTRYKKMVEAGQKEDPPVKAMTTCSAEWNRLRATETPTATKEKQRLVDTAKADFDQAMADWQKRVGVTPVPARHEGGGRWTPQNSRNEILQ